MSKLYCDDCKIVCSAWSLAFHETAQQSVQATRLRLLSSQIAGAKRRAPNASRWALRNQTILYLQRERFSLMKQLFLLFGKIFVFVTFAYGLIMSGVYLFMQIAFSHVNWLSVFHFVLVTGNVYIVLLVTMFCFGLLHYRLVRRISQGKTFDLSPIQQRDLVLQQSPSVSLELCSSTLAKLPARVIERNESKNYLIAQTRSSWKSWGNEIRTEITSADELNSRIKIICRPLLRTTLMDFGKSYEDIESLLNTLSELQR